MSNSPNEATVLSLLAGRMPLNWASSLNGILTASFSLTSTGQVIAAVTGYKIKVFAVKLIVSAAISVNWRDGGSTGTGLEGAQPIAANGGYVEGVVPPAFLFATTVGNELDLVISGSGTAAGRVSYWLAPAGEVS